MMGSWNTAQAGQPMLQQQQQMLLATHLAQQQYVARQQAQYNMAQLSLMQQAQVNHHHNLELIKNEALKLEAAKQAAAAAAAAAPAKEKAAATPPPRRQKQKQPPQTIYHVTQEDVQHHASSAHDLSSFASALSSSATAPTSSNTPAANAAAATTTTAASFISAASGSGVSANAAAGGSAFFTLDDAQLLSVRRSEESDEESPAMFDLPPLGFDVLDVHESCDSSPPPEGDDDKDEDADDDDDDTSSLAQPLAVAHLDSLSPQELLSAVADSYTIVAAKQDVGRVLKAVRAAGDVAWSADAVEGDAESVSVSCTPVPGGAATVVAEATLGVVPAKHLSRGADEGSNAAQVAGSIATRALEYARQGRAWYLYCAPSALSQAICAEAVAMARERLVADGVMVDLVPVMEAPVERPPVFLRSRKPDVYLVRPVAF